jgi:hypothetical protein
MARASEAEGGRVHFWCPGCDDVHTIGHEGPEAWTWNGDLDRPTFSPSVLVHMTKWHGTFEEYGRWTRPTHNVEPGAEATCHSFVTDGRIQFLGDCTHHLAGQTVDLPEWPYGEA